MQRIQLISYKIFLLIGESNNVYMKIIGVLPRYNTMKCQLQSMSGTLYKHRNVYINYSLK